MGHQTGRGQNPSDRLTFFEDPTELRPQRTLDLAVQHAYPKELVAFLTSKWDSPCSFISVHPQADAPQGSPLPSFDVLEYVLSVCYQASLLRNEERPVKFRLIIEEPERFAADHGPPKGLHRLLFSEPRPCNELELRRLAPSTDFYNSLIGARLHPEHGLQIWGVIHSGPRWVQALYGGGRTFQALPSSLVIHVTSPGRIAVCKGSTTVAILNAGQITCPSMDVFDSQWLRGMFNAARLHILKAHLAVREQSGKQWAKVSSEFLRMIKKQVIMRVISKIRYTHHGGTIICLPDKLIPAFCDGDSYVNLKYRFSKEEPRGRFGTLILNLANELAEAFSGQQEREVGWKEYVSSKNQNLHRLDEAIFEWAHLVAGLAAVDGAVFMTRRYELLGFGGEISGKLDRVEKVYRALDVEGDRTEPEETAWVGTRHHSAYRLCNLFEEVIAMIISQDGSVQVVRRKGDNVTCWNQVATSVMDV